MEIDKRPVIHTSPQIFRKPKEKTVSHELIAYFMEIIKSTFSNVKEDFVGD